MLEEKIKAMILKNHGNDFSVHKLEDYFIINSEKDSYKNIDIIQIAVINKKTLEYDKRYLMMIINEFLNTDIALMFDYDKFISKTAKGIYDFCFTTFQGEHNCFTKLVNDEFVIEENYDYTLAYYKYNGFGFYVKLSNNVEHSETIIFVNGGLFKIDETSFLEKINEINFNNKEFKKFKKFFSIINKPITELTTQNKNWLIKECGCSVKEATTPLFITSHGKVLYQTMADFYLQKNIVYVGKFTKEEHDAISMFLKNKNYQFEHISDMLDKKYKTNIGIICYDDISSEFYMPFLKTSIGYVYYTNRFLTKDDYYYNNFHLLLEKWEKYSNAIKKLNGVK